MSFSFLTNSACSSPLFNFSAPPKRPTETALARSFSFSRRLSRFDSDRGTKGRRGRGNFPSHPYSVKPARSRGRTRTERESKCRFFGRRQSSGFLSSAKLASINGASGGGRPIELTAAKAESADTGHGRLSISRIVPSFLSHLSIGTKSIGGSVRSPKCSFWGCGYTKSHLLDEFL